MTGRVLVTMITRGHRCEVEPNAARVEEEESSYSEVRTSVCDRGEVARILSSVPFTVI
jgi:hypothetical protein